MSKKQPEPGLGAFAAPVTFRVTQGGQVYEFKSEAITLTPAGSETKRALSGTGTFLPVGTPPPPPPPPLPVITGILDGFRVPVTGANAGSVVFITGSGLGASPGTVLFAGLRVIVTAWNEREIKAVLPPVAATTTAPLRIMLQAGSVALESAPFTVNFVDIPPPPPPPPPPGRVNVRDHGAKGDGTTNDVAAINALIRDAKAGAVLYFPAGTYALDDSLKVFRSDLAFEGDGDASVLRSRAGSYHLQIGSGQAYTGLAFRRLQFYGTPGQYMADGTSRGGVLNFGSKGTVFEDLLFTGCAEPILNAGVPGTTAGAIINRVRIFGHGRMAIFANGGEQITQCRIIQDDPNLFGERSSHGVYVHGGASNVLIADCEFANIRKYCIQAYSESIPSTTDNLQILRCLFRDSCNGVITAHGDVNAGILTNSRIEGNTFRGIFAGSSLAIKNGSGLRLLNNVFEDNMGAQHGHSGAHLYLGVWAGYEPGFWLKDVQVSGNTVKNADRGIWCLPSNGGKFTGVVIRGNQVSGCRQNYDITGPGVDWAPGEPPGEPAERQDSRPTDDSSRESWLTEGQQ
jgi:hypothetical protein